MIRMLTSCPGVFELILKHSQEFIIFFYESFGIVGDYIIWMIAFSDRRVEV